MVGTLEEVVDSLNMEVKRRHSVRLQNGECTIDLGFSLTDICTSLERISDHCSNIAVDQLLSDTDEFDAHEYLHHIKKEEGPEFDAKVTEFADKYRLPDYVPAPAEEPEEDQDSDAAQGGIMLHEEAIPEIPTDGSPASWETGELPAEKKKKKDKDEEKQKKKDKEADKQKKKAKKKKD